MKTQKFEGLTEKAVVAMAQTGDRSAYDFLVSKYTPEITQLVKAFYLKGGESEDLVQEGLIGLYEAIQDFKVDRNVKFRTFALLCIKRQLYSAMETANRDKHKPLNTYVSLSELGSEEQLGEVTDKIIETSQSKTPLDRIIDLELLKEYSERIEKTLTPLELAILIKYLEGNTYQEISRSTGRNTKSVDNAIQRIRKKLSSKGKI